MKFLNLADRAKMTNSVVSQWRTRAFDWRTANCVHLARSQCVAFGYDFPLIPEITSEYSIHRLMHKAGFFSIPALMDSVVQKTTVSKMLVGDIAVTEHPDDPRSGLMRQSVVIADGQGNFFGWHETAPGGLRVIKGVSAHIVGAWRL